MFDNQAASVAFLFIINLNNDYFDFTYCLFKKGLYICHVKQTQKLRIMRIEIVSSEGELITNFELEANPFKVGETININVSNYDKLHWNVEEAKGDYLIVKIEHFLRKNYLIDNKVSTSFTVSVEVRKLN